MPLLSRTRAADRSDACAARPPQEYRPFPNEAGRNARQELLEIPVMIRALALRPGLRVLEVGCGRGIALPVLHRQLRPVRLVGLDVDTCLLAEAGRRLRDTGVRAELIPGDVRHLPLQDASVDIVIDFGTCYHIARPDAALREIARVLAPEGIFVQETPLSQLLSHPIRAFGRRIPWRAEPRLRRQRSVMLWSSFRRALECG